MSQKRDVFDILMERPTGQQRINGFDVPRLFSLECEATGVQRDTLDRSHQYLLTATFVQEFWANNAQRDSSRRAAEKAMRYAIFAPVLTDIADAISAAHNGDRAATLDALNRLHNYFLGD